MAISINTFMKLNELFNTRLTFVTESAIVQYRNYYNKRDIDSMRLFEKKPRIVYSPVEERPSGMPRQKYERLMKTPWIIEIPTSKNMYKIYYRTSTEDDAIERVNYIMPDKNEMVGYEATKNGDWVGTIERELIERGYEVLRNDSKSTDSKYLSIKLPKGMLKIRFSNHSKGIVVGSYNRTHYGDSLDFSTGISRPEMIAKTASLLKTLDIARTIT